jgi:urate oxidase
VDRARLLEGDFETSFTEADNSKILPTDTMKNTVYSWLAAQRLQPSKSSPWSWATICSPTIRKSRSLVEIEEKAWERLVVDGAPEPPPSNSAGRRCTRCALFATRDASGPSDPASMDW